MRHRTLKVKEGAILSAEGLALADNDRGVDCTHDSLVSCCEAN